MTWAACEGRPRPASTSSGTFRRSRSSVGVQAAARADRGGPGHDGLAAHVDQALALHQIFGAVGQYLKTVLDGMLGSPTVCVCRAAGVVVADHPA